MVSNIRKSSDDKSYECKKKLDIPALQSRQSYSLRRRPVCMSYNEEVLSSLWSEVDVNEDPQYETDSNILSQDSREEVKGIQISGCNDTETNHCVSYGQKVQECIEGSAEGKYSEYVERPVTRKMDKDEFTEEYGGRTEGNPRIEINERNQCSKSTGNTEILMVENDKMEMPPNDRKKKLNNGVLCQKQTSGSRYGNNIPVEGSEIYTYQISRPQNTSSSLKNTINLQSEEVELMDLITIPRKGSSPDLSKKFCESNLKIGDNSSSSSKNSSESSLPGGMENSIATVRTSREQLSSQPVEFENKHTQMKKAEWKEVVRNEKSEFGNFENIKHIKTCSVNRLLSTCHICGIGFCRKRDLEIHMSTMHSVPESKCKVQRFFESTNSNQNESMHKIPQVHHKMKKSSYGSFLSTNKEKQKIPLAEQNSNYIHSIKVRPSEIKLSFRGVSHEGSLNERMENKSLNEPETFRKENLVWDLQDNYAKECYSKAETNHTLNILQTEDAIHITTGQEMLKRNKQDIEVKSENVNYDKTINYTGMKTNDCTVSGSLSVPRCSSSESDNEFESSTTDEEDQQVVYVPKYKINISHRLHRCQKCMKGFSRIVDLNVHNCNQFQSFNPTIQPEHFVEPKHETGQAKSNTRKISNLSPKRQSRDGCLQKNLVTKQKLGRPRLNSKEHKSEKILKKTTKFRNVQKNFTVMQNRRGRPRLSDIKFAGNFPNLKHPQTLAKSMCVICRRCFESQGSLDMHMRVHTGEKPFLCGICKSAFSQKGNLKTHMRIHTRECPYKCQYCQESFPQLSHLNYHKRTKHG